MNAKDVVAKYTSQPTDVLIAETLLITSLGDKTLRLREASAANLGYTRGGLYLDSARSLIRYIMANEREISWRKGAYDVFLPVREIAYRNSEYLPDDAAIELDSIVAAIEGAKYLAKDAEILWHFYAVSLDRSAHFFGKAARKLGIDIAQSPSEIKYLGIIRAFRNHIEHRDKAINSLAGPDWLTMFEDSKDGISFGYNRTPNGEIKFKSSWGDLKDEELIMPANNDGFLEFQAMMERTNESIISACTEKLTLHFADHPESLPNIEHVGNLMSETLTDIH